MHDNLRPIFPTMSVRDVRCHADLVPQTDVASLEFFNNGARPTVKEVVSLLTLWDKGLLASYGICISNQLG